MNEKTLNTVCGFGCLTAICFSRNTKPDISWVKNLASSLSAEKPSLILDSTGLYNSSLPFESIQSSQIITDNLYSLSISLIDESKASLEISKILKSIIELHATYPEILVLISEKHLQFLETLILNCDAICIYAPTEDSAEKLSEKLNFLQKFSGIKIWFPSSTLPNYLKSNFKNWVSYASQNNELSTNDFSKLFLNLRKINVLQKNSVTGLKKYFFKLFPILLLLVFFVCFFIPRPINSLTSSVRDMKHDRKQLSETPYFDFTFDGTESLQRLARYSIGKFHAEVASPEMIKEYITETLEKNDFTENLKNDDKILYPPKSSELRFYPSNILPAPENTKREAWQFFTKMISDSIAYLTEFYNEKATSNLRQHNGIDVASSKGARILAPFSAQAWTFQDDRGGTILGLANKKFVILFMHCDQLLYLNGQKVMAGDPIATIGMTGHTTGPHAHIVTGIVSNHGNKMLGGLRYKTIDPFEWYKEFQKGAKKRN